MNNVIKGADALLGKLHTLVPALKEAIIQDNSNAGPAQLILDAIKSSIDQSGLKDFSGQVKNSFAVVAVADGSIIIQSNARYASYLNFGSPPSAGRYVPGLGLRLHKTGMHPGNRPYNFMENAEKTVMPRIAEQHDRWFKRALQTIGLS